MVGAIGQADDQDTATQASTGILPAIPRVQSERNAAPGVPRNPPSHMDTPPATPEHEPDPFPAPVPPPGAVAPASRAVDAGRGIAWIVEAWALFKEAPGSWVASFVILAIMMLVLGLIPILGSIAAAMISPFLVAGLMLGARAIRDGDEMMVSHLFAGFGPRNGQLFVLGLIEFGMSLVVMIVAALFIFIVLGAAFVAVLAGQSPEPGATLAEGFWVSILMMLAILLALFIPITMAAWFAPALVALDGVEPWPALVSSFQACMKNMVPFLLYGLVMFVLAFVATIPLGLGWLLLGPVAIASIYTAYRDIYGRT